MDCPRCGATAVSTPECPACGVILAKASPPRAARPRPRPPAARLPSRTLVLAALGLLAAAAAVYLRRGPGPAATRPSPSSERPPEAAAETVDTAVSVPPVDALAPPPLSLPEAAPPVADEALRAARAAEADRESASRLAERLRARLPLSAEDVRTAEDLHARYPEPARDLLEAVLIDAAAGERASRRFDRAGALLERALAVAPSSPRAPRALLALRLEAGDWVAAEGAGRALLSRSPADAGAVRGLAYALVRQDRSGEAAEALAAFLDAHPDPETRSFLERIRRGQGSEAPLDEAKLAHFHVRYDGETHEDVGREVLRVLDRHYATLARTFDHEPTSPIPVILLSRESYYDTIGAPAWSGGQYDAFDGRVRIPIGGLTVALTPDLDETVLHELTHAFVSDISHGAAPREIHEGLAQLMEGKRAATLLGDEGLRALADGRLSGVRAFYASALSLVEDLVAQRGQGGVNDLLRAMGETGSADEAFRRVYGKDLDGLRRDWATRLRQRYGS